MNPLKILVFESLKSAGSTITSLKMAILHQLQFPEDRVLFLQLSQNGDLNLYLNTEFPNNLSNLLNFIKTSEWTPDTLGKITVSLGCDFLDSVSLNSEIPLTPQNLDTTLKLISQKHTHLYIDLESNMPEKIKHFLYKKCDQLFVLSHITPQGLKKTKTHLSQIHKFKDSINLLLMQSSNLSLHKEIDFTDFKSVCIKDTLPIETTGLWAQIYEGYPLAFQKKSKLKKSLTQLLTTLFKSHE